MLRRVHWKLLTDVSRQSIGPIFKGPAVSVCIETVALNNNRIRAVKEVHGVFRELRTEIFKSIET